MASSETPKITAEGAALSAGSAVNFWTGLGATLLMCLGLGLGGCDTPSSHIDGGDLHGVFDRDARAAEAGASASAAASTKPKRKKPKPQQDAGPIVAPVSRQRISGSCIDPAGTPQDLFKRAEGRPACRRARVLEWRDPNGTPRYGCVYHGPDIEQRKPLPLFIFFHAEQDDPAMLGRKTRLRQRYSTLDLTGDPAHPGFIVLAVQGRRFQGSKHELLFDTDYTASDNVDALTTDHFVSQLSAEGLLDRRRIYTLGESRGGEMAVLYAFLRPSQVVGFATFGTDASKLTWSCEAPSPPAAILYRACDSVMPCEEIEQWLQLREDRGMPTMSLRLGAGKATEPNCAVSRKCTKKVGQANHYRWPKPREQDLLEHLARFSFES